MASVAAAAGSEARAPQEAPAEASPAEQAPDGAAEAPTAATQGLRAYRDPATGKLGPAPAGEALEVSGAIEALVNESDEGLVERVGPAGSVLVDLQGRFKSFAVATVSPDGELSVDCTDSAEEANQILQAAAAPEEVSEND